MLSPARNCWLKSSHVLCVSPDHAAPPNRCDRQIRLGISSRDYLRNPHREADLSLCHLLHLRSRPGGAAQHHVVVLVRRGFSLGHALPDHLVHHLRVRGTHERLSITENIHAARVNIRDRLRNSRASEDPYMSDVYRGPLAVVVAGSTAGARILCKQQEHGSLCTQQEQRSLCTLPSLYRKSSPNVPLLVPPHGSSQSWVGR